MGSLWITLLLTGCSQEASLRRAPQTGEEAPTAPPPAGGGQAGKTPGGGAPSEAPAPTTTATTEPPLPPKPASALTWDKDVKGLLDERCSECHHAGKAIDLGRFPFMSGTRAENADRLVAAIGPGGAMPPAPRQKLTDPAILKTIEKWRADGMYP